MIKKEFQIFFTALAFYTRIPCYKICNYSPKYVDESTKYLPLIGWIVGGIGGLVFIISKYFLPVYIAILLSIISTILITGAFHEDGFADFCDGAGGGFDKEQILRIMKDSRIGSYALIGMIGLLGLKYAALISINTDILPLILIAGHSISRYTAGSFLFTHEYVRKNDDNAKSLKISKKSSFMIILISSFFGVLPIFWLGIKFLLILIPIFITRQIFSSYFTRKLGGYTGDCLGAVQQITEVVFYIFAVMAPWKYI